MRSGIGGGAAEVVNEGGEVAARIEDADGRKMAMRGGTVEGIGLGRGVEKGTRDDDHAHGATSDGAKKRRIDTGEGGENEVTRRHVDGGMTQGTGTMIDDAETPKSSK